jgi:hypothetical protein
MTYEEIELNGTVYIKKTVGEMIYIIPTDPANSDYAAYLESLNDDTETE